MSSELGDRWLLLHGLTRESGHWNHFLPLLQSAFPCSEITALDLPGVGRFHGQPSPWTLRGLVDFVRNTALEHGKLERPVTLLGLSLGGMIAWEWLQTYPSDACGAVLVATSFGGLSPFYERLRWQCYRECYNAMRVSDPRQRERVILALLLNNRQLIDNLADEWSVIQTLRPVGFKNLIRHLLAATLYYPDSVKPEQPVLLLNSAGDRLVSPECSSAIGKKWDLPLKTHPWAGHDITTDDGDWVVAQINAWCAG